MQIEIDIVIMIHQHLSCRVLKRWGTDLNKRDWSCISRCSNYSSAATNNATRASQSCAFPDLVRAHTSSPSESSAIRVPVATPADSGSYCHKRWALMCVIWPTTWAKAPLSLQGHRTDCQVTETVQAQRRLLLQACNLGAEVLKCWHLACALYLCHTFVAHIYCVYLAAARSLLSGLACSPGHTGDTRASAQGMSSGLRRYTCRAHGKYCVRLSEFSQNRNTDTHETVRHTGDSQHHPCI